MNICIVGWYGTETLGDRAILLGLSKIFNDTFGSSKIFLGSLNDFYSERCIFEDKPYYKEIAPDVNIEIFDVKSMMTYQSVIRKSDIVVMGGGPIMDLYELGVIQFGFGYAKSQGKKTAVLGCGIGPLFNDFFQKTALEILSLSDLIIFRDEISVRSAQKLPLTHKKNVSSSFYYLDDPAIIPACYYKEQKENLNKDDYLVVSLREFPKTVYPNLDERDLDEFFRKCITDAAHEYEKVILTPMHTFSIGGDDRLYLSRIKHLANQNNVSVLQKPLSVYELFELISNAAGCIGMRYHSVVFQTILNGKNAILDYTEPGKGKISGFLDLIGGRKHYENLYLNLQTNKEYCTDLIRKLKFSGIFMNNIDCNEIVGKYGELLKEILKI